MAGKHDQKKTTPIAQKKSADQEQDQEHEGASLEAPEPEHSRMQNQMGNAAVAAILAGRGNPDNTGAGAVEIERGRRKESEKEGHDFGGDDDPLDDSPLTIEDLSRSWNPTTKRSEDRPKFLETMPSDELIEEDEELIAAMIAWESADEPIPPSDAMDALFQPTIDVVELTLRSWAKAAARWAGPGVFQRVLALSIHPPRSVLQDPYARVLPFRGRLGALTTLTLAGSPPMVLHPSAATCAYMSFLLELEGRGNLVQRLRNAVHMQDNQLPTAINTFGQFIEIGAGQVQPVVVSDLAASGIRSTLDLILNFSDARRLVPNLVAAQDKGDEEQEDPLGLDSIMAEFTGGDVDPEAAAFRTAIQAAERLASTCAETRVRLATTCVVVCHVASLWSAGSPTRNMQMIAELIDRDTSACLQLLVEIARAAQTRQVPLRGLKVGLGRAAKAINDVRQSCRDHIVQVIGGILPGDPVIDIESMRPPGDPLSMLPEDGNLSEATAFIASMPQTLEVQCAAAWMTTIQASEPTHYIAPLQKLRKQAIAAHQDQWAAALGILLGSCLSRSEDWKAILALTDDQIAIGRRRRNGALIADAGILKLESHHAQNQPDRLAQEQLRIGHMLWRIGARGPMSLIARWEPPESIEE